MGLAILWESYYCFLEYSTALVEVEPEEWATVDFDLIFHLIAFLSSLRKGLEEMS